MRFIEAPVFTRAILELMDDEEYRAVQLALLLRPEMGPAIRHSAGLRKIRWSAKGTGKRGGCRIIYYWDESTETFFMLYAYRKNEQDDLTANQPQDSDSVGPRGIQMRKKDFDALVTGIRQAGKIRRGEMKPGRVTEFAPADVKAIREQLGKSQAKFAAMLGVSVATLQNWEQGRRRPEGPARALLKIAAENPKAVSAALEA